MLTLIVVFDTNSAGSENGELPWWQMAETDTYAWFVLNKSKDSIKTVIFRQRKIRYQAPLKESGDINIHQDLKEKWVLEMDSSNAKILEALQHPQTHARKAENTSKEAYKEKDHVVKLLLRHAS